MPRSLPEPPAALRASIVVPARDEEERIGACVAALAAQTGVARNAFEVLLVLDACTDATEAVAVRTAAVASTGGSWLALHTIVGPGQGVGPARKLGMDVAAARLRVAGAGAGGLIASTDADSIVAADWLASLLAAGAPAVGGPIELDPAEALALPPEVLTQRRGESVLRLEAVRVHAPEAEHHQFSGANLAVTVGAYESVGGLPEVPALEDEALERALRAEGIPIAYSLAPRVRTSARTSGRTPRGLAQVLRTAAWSARPVAVPDAPLDPGVLVIDAGRGARGAAIHDALLAAAQPRVAADAGTTAPSGSPPGSTPHAGPARLPDGGTARESAAADTPAGAGPAPVPDASTARETAAADIVLVLGDGASAAGAAGLVALLRSDPARVLVRASGPAHPLDELVARPLLNVYAPDVAVLTAPLTSCWAIRRSALEALWLPESDAADLAVLVDVWRTHGLDAIGEGEVAVRSPAPPAPADGRDAYQLQLAMVRRFAGPLALSNAYSEPAGTRWARIDERPPIRP